MQEPIPPARRRPALNPERKLSNQARPRVSLIIPCFHAGDTLESTLCSVFDQGYADLEVLVVDGGSRDQTLDVIERYETQINWYDAHTDTGPAEAVNRALDVATGEIIGFLDADALLMPQVLGDVVRKMCSVDRPSWLIGQAVALDETGQLAEPLASIRSLSLASMLRRTQLEPARGSVFFRRSLLGEVGPLDVKLRFAWTFELYARLLAEGHRPGVISRGLAAVRMNEACSIMRTVRKGQERVTVARRYLDQLDPWDRYTVWQSCDERARVHTLALAELDPSSASRYLWDELTHHPGWIADPMYRDQLIAASQPAETSLYRLAA
ncbi:glycosyltransferase [Mucisphaera calidilacus]|uniref:PGL p-HBAD biosynthesis glycosyltransferase n=1 Tax=Mucisphaera calidilacus TaxID=2527982 RepID=A0A518BZ23_9BACT|nr:glycosyltransferase [Mucisphaera calidilacus]QDU72219.1 PGL p-HBAD biosynthesis glycosyltransferase [Mucisphaera calidilacus]